MVSLREWCLAVSALQAKCPAPRGGTLWVVGCKAGRYHGCLVTRGNSYVAWRDAANEIHARLGAGWTVAAAEFITQK